MGAPRPVIVRLVVAQYAEPPEAPGTAWFAVCLFPPMTGTRTGPCWGQDVRLSLGVMEDEGLQVRIDVGVEPDADAADLDEATLQLRRELLELDVQDVERPAEGSPPPGARAVEAALLGTLVVTATQELVGAVVRAVAGWLARRPNRSVKLEIAGDSIEVTDPSAEDQQRLIEAFLTRHAPASS